MAKSADRYYLLDAKKIIEQGFDPARAEVSESVFSLSNERMGVRGYFEEGGALPGLRGCYLGGVYEQAPHKPEAAYPGLVNRTHYMAAAADPLMTSLTVSGERLDLSRCAFSDFRRVLDMDNGLLSRSFVWHTAAGRVQVCFERLVGMDRADTLGQRVTLCALDGDAQAEAALGVDGNIVHRSSGKCQWRRLGDAPDALTLATATTEIAVRYTPWDVLPGTKQTVTGCRMLGVSSAFPLKKGQSVVLEHMVTVQVARRGEAFAETKPAPSFAQLLESNARHWAGFWRENDILIEGDPENQQGIRYCLFQLHSTYRGLDPRDNIGAKGLTGEAYNGHAFWDTETYALPFYLFTDPAAARSLLVYRYRTLPQARERAAQLHLRGACYPVATMDGTEACTLWQHSSLQMQPSTAVAYAIRLYAETTGDCSLLWQEGAEMLFEIARYVLSRGAWTAEGFGFFGVMGPDEFHMMVGNDYYTNFMGQKALAYAADTWDALPDARRRALQERLGLLPDEPVQWRRAADGMRFPLPADGVLEQHDGYFRLPHTDIQAIPQEDFPLYEHWSYDRIYRTDMIKQPDVLMAMLLYPGDFSPDQLRANYAYYEPRCIHESSLSPSVHAIIAATLGLKEEAVRFFRFATRMDLDNYNRNTCEGLHLSSVAAAWMTIVEGFGGVRFDGGQLRLSPWLPRGWTRLCFSLHLREGLLRVNLDEEGVTLRCEDGAVPLRLYGQPVVVGARPVTAAYQ